MTRAVHRLRRRLRALLRDEVARTVGDPGQVDDELRHLFAELGPWRMDVTIRRRRFIIE